MRATACCARVRAVRRASVQDRLCPRQARRRQPGSRRRPLLPPAAGGTEEPSPARAQRNRSGRRAEREPQRRAGGRQIAGQARPCCACWISAATRSSGTLPMRRAERVRSRRKQSRQSLLGAGYLQVARTRQPQTARQTRQVFSGRSSFGSAANHRAISLGFWRAPIRAEARSAAADRSTTRPSPHIGRTASGVSPTELRIAMRNHGSEERCVRQLGERRRARGRPSIRRASARPETGHADPGRPPARTPRPRARVDLFRMGSLS